METNSTAAAPSPSWFAAHFGAALILTAILAAGPGLAPAHAAELDDMSCVGSWWGFNCVNLYARAGDPNVRLVPHSMDEGEKAREHARDRRWSARCHPTVTRDQYGVARYRYAAPGCEFGVGAD